MGQCVPGQQHRFHSLTMNTYHLRRRPHQAGSALAITLVMTSIALAILASAMTWSANSTRLTHRSIQHTRSIAAAEAATEKVVGRITQDFVTGGDKAVNDSLDSYRMTVPTSSDSSYWSQWEFNDAIGNASRTYVQAANSNSFIVLSAPYEGLRAFVTTYTVVAHARDTTSSQIVIGGVLQEVDLARIPIFQFALYSSSDMETCCAEPYTQKGRVHANGKLYAGPDSILTFQGDVTAVSDIIFGRHPLDPRGNPGGSVVYQAGKTYPVPAMNIPIGTNNSPLAVREIIYPPPFGEDPSSTLGRLRFYNQADMILTVSNSGISATSGRINNFATVIPTNELAAIVTTNNTFTDKREGKLVQPIEINVAALKAWSATNSNLRVALGSKDVASVYVVDGRTLPGTSLGAVRIVNGVSLPSRGLTVATARPLYVQGHFNQPNSAHLGTSNTTATLPAALVSDAITILSENWLDSNSAKSESSRKATATTVNAAILTGAVDTTKKAFSGGMENFMRFLEDWSPSSPAVSYNYNGSLVKMFPSFYATNVWGKSDVYSAPKRAYTYDLNFNDPTKLPPLTPSLETVFRGQWTTVAANQNSLTGSP
jgi:hypothetical protein